MPRLLTISFEVPLRFLTFPPRSRHRDHSCQPYLAKLTSSLAWPFHLETTSYSSPDVKRLRSAIVLTGLERRPDKAALIQCRAFTAGHAFQILYSSLCAPPFARPAWETGAPTKSRCRCGGRTHQKELQETGIPSAIAIVFKDQEVFAKGSASREAEHSSRRRRYRFQSHRFQNLSDPPWWRPGRRRSFLGSPVSDLDLHLSARAG